MEKYVGFASLFFVFPALQQKMVVMEVACDVVCAEKP